uniref:Uncharacterized protein n=1 Tax=Lynx canadensis TaxID=61383 RepID=A0A667GL66_LYNCA
FFGKTSIWRMSRSCTHLKFFSLELLPFASLKSWQVQKLMPNSISLVSKNISTLILQVKVEKTPAVKATEMDLKLCLTC